MLEMALHALLFGPSPDGAIRPRVLQGLKKQCFRI